jgi:hypothetical protein
MMGISDFHRRLILLQVVLYRIVFTGVIKTTAPKLSNARPISVERFCLRYILERERPNTVVEIKATWGICGECNFSKTNYFFSDVSEIRVFVTLG